MSTNLRIVSYFSLPTDLAEEMRTWPEFVSGKDYDDLCSQKTGEKVSVRYVESDEVPHIVISATASSTLFDRVVGRVIYALSAHSDNLMVDRDAKSA